MANRSLANNHMNSQNVVVHHNFHVMIYVYSAQLYFILTFNSSVPKCNFFPKFHLCTFALGMCSLLKNVCNDYEDLIFVFLVKKGKNQQEKKP